MFILRHANVAKYFKWTETCSYLYSLLQVTWVNSPNLLYFPVNKMRETSSVRRSKPASISRVLPREDPRINMNHKFWTAGVLANKKSCAAANAKCFSASLWEVLSAQILRSEAEKTSQWVTEHEEIAWCNVLESETLDSNVAYVYPQRNSSLSWKMISR